MRNNRSPLDVDPPQFLHQETFARSSTGNRWGADDIVNEFHRAPGCYSPDIQTPMRPIMRFQASDPLSWAIALIDDLKAQSLAATGQTVRSTAQLLAAGTTSFPEPIEVLKKEPKIWRESQAWFKRNDGFFHDWFGEGLFAIGEHRDEKFLHSHFFCLPYLDSSGKLTLGDRHPGYGAAMRARQVALEANGGSRQGIPLREIYDNAYKGAMIEFQDAYMDQVGKQCGMTRTGEIPRSRRERSDHLALKAMEARAEKAEADAAEARAQLAKAREETAKAMADADRSKAIFDRVKTLWLEREELVDRIETAGATVAPR